MATEADPSLLVPLILGLTAAGPIQDSPNPAQETEDQVPLRLPPDRILLISPFTHTLAVFETIPNGPVVFGYDMFSSKSGQRPASKSSIDNLPRVEILRGENDDVQCVVCLEEWEDGEEAKEMPCKHRFHGECVEKWLRINGCCPVCRREMPVDEDDDSGVKIGRGEVRDFGISDNIDLASDHQENED